MAFSKNFRDAVQEGWTVYPEIWFANNFGPTEDEIGSITNRDTPIFSPHYGISLSQGQNNTYGEVIDWGTLSRSTGLKGQAIQGLSITFKIQDTKDRRLARAFYTENMFHRRVVIYLFAVENPVFGDTLPVYYQETLFDGIITAYNKDPNNVWTITVGSDDRAISGLVKIPDLAPYDWPDIHDDYRGKPGHLVIGTFDSTGTSRPGFLPAPYIDTVGYRYLASYTHIASVDNVWSDGSLQTGGGTDYSISYITVNGRDYTVIDFVADQGSNDVTFDATGMTDDYESTGNLVDNPVDFVTQFMPDFADTTISTNAPTGAAAGFMTRQFANISKLVKGDMTGEQIVNSLADNFNLVFYWDLDGKLGLTYYDWAFDDVYLEDETDPEHFYVGRRGVSPTFSYVFDTSYAADEIYCDYIYDEATGDYIKSLKIADRERNINNRESRSLAWFKSDPS